MNKILISFYVLLISFFIFKAEDEPKIEDIKIMSDDEFIKIMNTQEKVISRSEVGLKMHLMAQEAMKILYFINNKYNTPSELRRWMSLLIHQELDEGFG